FEEREPPGVVRRGEGTADFARLPERAAVDEEVQLVEQRGPVPRRPLGVIDDRALPGLDRGPPGGCLAKRVDRQIPGAIARTCPFTGVSLPTAPPATELDHRQIPGQPEPDRRALPGRQRARRCEG